MKLFGFELTRAVEKRTSPETASIPVSAESFLAFFGRGTTNLPMVTIDNALTVPAVWAAVSFLSRTLAALPLHAYRRSNKGPQRISGKFATVIHEAPNPGQDAFGFRAWFWQQVFTGGRGLAWIERTPQGVEALWPIDPSSATIHRQGMALIYEFGGRRYPAEDIIDVPFMLKADGLGHYGPVAMAGGAIQLSLAMNDYASKFFAGGGIPPLALVGPMPQGGEAMRRAMGDISRAIETAKASDKPIFAMPPGHELKPIGFDPEKGQMTDARRFQVEEIARAYQLPPVFLQDLSRSTFTNAEQQDLHLVKHLIGQWAAALEAQMNLKIFGRLNGARYVEHNLDGLMRGDFQSRIEGITRGIQAGLLTPNEGRALENRPAHENPAANDLFMQGATVALGTPPMDSGAQSNEPGITGDPSVA